jgi:hypothetical protein
VIHDRCKTSSTYTRLDLGTVTGPKSRPVNIQPLKGREVDIDVLPEPVKNGQLFFR